MGEIANAMFFDFIKNVAARIKMAKIQKTNAMRILDSAKAEYDIKEYDVSDENYDGNIVAKKLGQDPYTVYKTLVTKGHSNQYYVFCIPVCEELDLKKAAKAAGEKNVEMIHVSEINKITGYVRGGCSPFGMKKQFSTYIDKSCEGLEKIYVSGGKRGLQVGVSPKYIIDIAGAKTEDIIR